MENQPNFFEKVKKAVIYDIFNNVQESKVSYHIKQIKNKRIFNYSRNRLKNEKIAEYIIDKKEHEKTIKAHDESVFCVLRLKNVNTPNNTIITGGYDHKIKVWNGDNGKLLKTFIGHGDVINSLIELPIGYGFNFVSASHDKSIRFWNLETDDCKKLSGEHTHFITCLIHFKLKNNKESYLVSGSYDKTLKKWNMNDLQDVRTIKAKQLVICIGKLKASDRELVVSGHVDSYIRLWDIKREVLLKELNMENKIQCIIYLKWCYDDHSLALAGCKNDIQIFNVETETKRPSLKGHIDHVYCIVQMPYYSDSILVSGSADKTLKFWNIIKSQMLKSINAHQSYISEREKMKNLVLISGSRDQSIKIWRHI